MDSCHEAQSSPSVLCLTCVQPWLKTSKLWPLIFTYLLQCGRRSLCKFLLWLHSDTSMGFSIFNSKSVRPCTQFLEPMVVSFRAEPNPCLFPSRMYSWMYTVEIKEICNTRGHNRFSSALFVTSNNQLLRHGLAILTTCNIAYWLYEIFIIIAHPPP